MQFPIAVCLAVAELNGLSEDKMIVSRRSGRDSDNDSDMVVLMLPRPHLLTSYPFLPSL